MRPSSRCRQAYHWRSRPSPARLRSRLRRHRPRRPPLSPGRWNPSRRRPARCRRLRRGRRFPRSEDPRPALHLRAPRPRTRQLAPWNRPALRRRKPHRCRACPARNPRRSLCPRRPAFALKCRNWMHPGARRHRRNPRDPRMNRRRAGVRRRGSAKDPPQMQKRAPPHLRHRRMLLRSVPLQMRPPPHRIRQRKQCGRDHPLPC